MRCDKCFKRTEYFITVKKWKPDKPHPNYNDRPIEYDWCLYCAFQEGRREEEKKRRREKMKY